jgi:hypothetical protein
MHNPVNEVAPFINDELANSFSYLASGSYQNLVRSAKYCMSSNTTEGRVYSRLSQSQRFAKTGLSGIVNLIKDLFQMIIFSFIAPPLSATNPYKDIFFTHSVIDIKAIGIGFVGAFSPCQGAKLVKQISPQQIEQLIELAPPDPQNDIIEFLTAKLEEDFMRSLAVSLEMTDNSDQNAKTMLDAPLPDQNAETMLDAALEDLEAAEKREFADLD